MDGLRQVNDMGGTLINESISTEDDQGSAGASFGQLVRPAEFRHLIREAGRVPDLDKLNKHVFVGVDTE
jgi:2-iminoacetate synthase ThiH